MRRTSHAVDSAFYVPFVRTVPVAALRAVLRSTPSGATGGGRDDPLGRQADADPVAVVNA
jgi:hypothetical protein